MPTGRAPQGVDHISQLVRECFGFYPDEAEEVTGEREVRISLLRLLPPTTHGRTDGRNITFIYLFQTRLVHIIKEKTI